ncbi:Molybdopterin adenylyltransferase [Roseimaritima multifibrata]|uniref:Molybdopterin adenylyltransferase n=1 Tax=Roseimaritima multifibrata TaxID=1930274 RepID=A0A517MJL3_9BACT|nr:molybdopterin adenylyltransferase [Roseimaritima multifibrata]QDS94977.1 Molybdopterin adenylyltransferase [Roseimaritima multifibrata]
MPLQIGVLTISDRASQGVYEDLGGPAIRDYFAKRSVFAVDYFSQIIPDEIPAIQTALIEMADDRCCPLILTTGGTGPTIRDVTPEATENVCDKILPGFGEQMRTASLRFVPTAILSRQLAGIRQQSLIINLPGKPTAIAECLDAVIEAVPYCLKLIGGGELKLHPPER